MSEDINAPHGCDARGIEAAQQHRRFDARGH